MAKKGLKGDGEPGNLGQNETSFEDSMARLEEIVEQMESADLPLEQIIERYEESMRLIAACNSKLEAAEKRIEHLTTQRKEKSEPIAEERVGEEAGGGNQQEDLL